MSEPAGETRERPWIYGYQLTFEDGPPEYQLLGDAVSEEECEQIADMIPAIAYSGTRAVKAAILIWTNEL